MSGAFICVTFKEFLENIQPFSCFDRNFILRTMSAGHIHTYIMEQYIVILFVFARINVSNHYDFGLPYQMIYSGKTKRCLPDRNLFPDGFLLNYNTTHWSYEDMTKKLINGILVP